MQENYSRLLTYAYNITGSYEDAQDLVQDVIEKYISLDRSEIRNETNFLIKSTINHAINFKNRHTKKWCMANGFRSLSPSTTQKTS